MAPKFYGAYIVLRRIGQVAYQLDLPNHSKLHHVFHVSFLNKVIELSATLKPTFLSWM
jgi:hypothetical protein